MANIIELRTPPDTRCVRVSVGPSLSSLNALFEANLGSGFAVADAFDPITDEAISTRIAVLGTTEIPQGELLVRQAGLSGVILVGLGPHAEQSAQARALVTKLVDAIWGLAAGIGAGAGAG